MTLSAAQRKMIAENIHAAREASGHSKQTIAECVGLSPSSYSQIESGKNAPSLAVIIKLADVLHVSIDDLVNEKTNSSGSTALSTLFAGLSEEDTRKVRLLLESMLRLMR